MFSPFLWTSCVNSSTLYPFLEAYREKDMNVGHFSLWKMLKNWSLIGLLPHGETLCFMQANMKRNEKEMVIWSHGSCDSSVWRHIFWENDIFSVSSGMKQQWTELLAYYSDRKSAEHNKCGKGKTWDHLTAIWHSEPQGLSFDSVLCVAMMSTSPSPHLPVTPLLITAIILSREGISYLLLSCDDAWHLLFSRVCEQASITPSITARSAS